MNAPNLAADHAGTAGTGKRQICSGLALWLGTWALLLACLSAWAQQI